jgi:hypothetical protein
MRLVCPKCQIELRPKKNGVAVEAMTVDGPYQLWVADLLSCPGCDLEVIARFAPRPLVEHFQSDYAKTVENWSPIVRFWANQRERQRYEAWTEGAV